MLTMNTDEFRAGLKKKILSSPSQEAVKRVIDVVVKELNPDGENIAFFIQFVDKLIYSLELYDPMNQTALEWSNIKMARIYLLQIKLKKKFEIGLS